MASAGFIKAEPSEPNVSDSAGFIKEELSEPKVDDHSVKKSLGARKRAKGGVPGVETGFEFMTHLGVPVGREVITVVKTVDDVSRKMPDTVIQCIGWRQTRVKNHETDEIKARVLVLQWTDLDELVKNQPTCAEVLQNCYPFVTCGYFGNEKSSLSELQVEMNYVASIHAATAAKTQVQGLKGEVSASM